MAESGAILVDVIDLARRLPTVAGAVIRAKLDGARLIVVGTRSHRVAEIADLFLRIRPNTESLLYGATAKVIEDRGFMNLPFIKSRCRDYQPFLAQLRRYDLVQAAEGCGVSSKLIEAAALAYAGARSAAVLYSSSMGEVRAKHPRPRQFGSAHRNLGKQGAGIFALAEQNNLQGVCESSGVTRPAAGLCARFQRRLAGGSGAVLGRQDSLGSRPFRATDPYGSRRGQSKSDSGSPAMTR